MPTLSDARMAELLTPFVANASLLTPQVLAQFSSYLELLLRWNARTNLTSVREPEDIVQRHFGESVFAAKILASRVAAGDSLLDLGSGAGFPGVPIHIFLPQLQVTLAESQGKKASFLREVARSLGVTAEVWAARVETMPWERRFNIVTLRAVDRMDAAVSAATDRVSEDGLLVLLTGNGIQLPQNWSLKERYRIPNAEARFVHLASRVS